jgi:hypothetical protein
MRRVVPLAVIVACVVGACLGPTEIQIVITSNACDRLQVVDVYVGGAALANAPTASLPGCADKTLASTTVGSLVIVPSGSTQERLQISVVGTLPGAACDGPSPMGSDCIVAKRSLSFSPHTALTLPIELNAACAGFVCPDPNTQSCTVINGVPTCVGDNCDTNPAACGLDAGGVDATSNDALSEDATDAQACPDPVDAGIPTLSWSFESPPNGDGNVHEDLDLAKARPLLSTSKLTIDPAWGCNQFLETTSTMPQDLAVDDQKLNASSFLVAFEFNAAMDGKLLTLLPLGAAYGGFIVGLAGGALQVYFDGTVGSTPLTDTVDVTKGWHSFAMEVQPTDAGMSTVKFWRDGIAVAPTGPAIYHPAYHVLRTGGDVWIDQLRIFAY